MSASRYPTLPAVRMGKRAIDLRFQKQGLGGAPFLPLAKAFPNKP